MAKHKIYTMSAAKVYFCYITKAEKKGRTKSEVDEIIDHMRYNKTNSTSYCYPRV